MAQELRIQDPDINRMRIEWIRVPADLSHLVHTFYSIELGDCSIDEATPAYSAQLLVVSRGEAELRYAQGGSSRTGSLFLNAPQLQAGRIRVKGPFEAIAASLTPLGWATLTAQPVDEVHDCEIPPEAFTDPDTVRDIEAWAERHGPATTRRNDALVFLDAILRNGRFPIKRRNREFVEIVTRWLSSGINPPLDTLYQSLALSPRHIQRLSRQFFGASPTQVLLRHRAIRTAMMLSNPELSQSLRDELSVTYFDQAHLIRNMRRYIGRTPADLGPGSFVQQSLDPAGHGATAIVLQSD